MSEELTELIQSLQGLEKEKDIVTYSSEIKSPRFIWVKSKE